MANIKDFSNSLSRSIIYRKLILISWFISLYLYFIVPEGMDTTFMSYILMNTIICSIIFLSYHKLIFKKINLVSISYLFIIGFFISHFQIALTHVFGFEIDSVYFQNYIWGNTKSGNLALTISSLGLLSFYLGFSYGKIKKEIYRDYSRFIGRYKLITKVFTYLSYLFYILFFITSGSYKYGNYGAGDGLGISSYFAAIFNIFISSAIILKSFVLNKEIKNTKTIREYLVFFGKSLSLLVFWHILFSTYAGDRGPVIVFLILYFGLYAIRVLNKKYTLVLIICFFVFPIILSILGASRSRTSKDSFSSRIGSSNYESRYSSNFSKDNVPGLSTLELALSVRCVNHTIQNVPEKHDYRYGAYQLQQISSAVPFLSGFLKNEIINYEDYEDSSADFVTFLIQGNKNTYGDGTTPVVDLYLDFGTFGVFLGFLIFGIFVKRADFTLFYGRSTTLFHWISIMFFLSGAMYLGRGTFLYYLQRIVQMYLVIMVFNSFIGKRNVLK
tara:strand:- start:4788 stop:6287 length:1500 start_codon:yes stop_codon:yes gene_type:complete